MTMVLHVFNRQGMVIAFKINQNYIAAELCENRDKPQMHCQGKCFLAKKIKQAEQNEKKETANAQEKANEFFFGEMASTEIAEYLISLKTKSINPFYLHRKPVAFCNKIFKPPRNIA